MGAVKKTTSVSSKKTADIKSNPFSKLIDDKKRIAKAVMEKVKLSTLTDIKFVRPL